MPKYQVTDPQDENLKRARRALRELVADSLHKKLEKEESEKGIFIANKHTIVANNMADIVTPEAYDTLHDLIFDTLVTGKDPGEERYKGLHGKLIEKGITYDVLKPGSSSVL